MEDGIRSGFSAERFGWIPKTALSKIIVESQILGGRRGCRLQARGPAPPNPFGCNNRVSEPRQLLKVEPQRKLHNPPAPITRCRAERRIDLRPGCVEPCGGVDGRPLGMIERIIEFPSKLELQIFMEGEVFKSSQIPLILTRAPEHLPRGCANRT